MKHDPLLTDFDTDALAVLTAKTEAERDIAYHRFTHACTYDPETERYIICDGQDHCLCPRGDDYKEYALLLARIRAGRL